MFKENSPVLELVLAIFQAGPVSDRLVDVVGHELRLLLRWQLKEIEGRFKSSIKYRLTYPVIDNLTVNFK